MHNEVRRNLHKQLLREAVSRQLQDKLMKLKEVNRDEVDTIIKRDYALWETVDIEKVKGELADVVRSYSSNYKAERQAFTFWMSGTRHYLLVDYDENLGLETRLYRIKDSKA